MTKAEGYLVVLKSEVIRKEFPFNNPNYRGLYRTPPFLMETYEKGFDDPYAFGNQTNEEDLIPTLGSVHKVQAKYSELYKPEEMETIYVQTWEGEERTVTKVSNSLLLGYDVAGGRLPFWSIVGDCPPLNDVKIGPLLTQLNSNGLFDSGELAQEYFTSHLEFYSYGREQGLRVWAIYLIENQPQSVKFTESALPSS
jgi:hypothetical protein